MTENLEKFDEEQIYDLLTGKEVSWQAIIHDLINTEQLDPWNIDLALLANKYLKKIRELEEANFFISSRVLLAASLLLRIKSEILLNQYVKSLDEILFGKREELKDRERIEIDQDELPILYPKTPLPRFKRVSLQELISALNKAINTETRRIKKEIKTRQAMKDTEIVFPKTRINIKQRIRRIYAKILTSFKKKKDRIGYTELVGNGREERIASFLPVLHLDNQQKIWLEQHKHLDEIWVWLYSYYTKKIRPRQIKKLRTEIEKKKQEIQKINADFENPLANFFGMIE